MMTMLLVNTALGWEIQTTEGGEEYHWPKMPLDYVWVSEGAPEVPRLRRAVQVAFDTWSDVEHADITVEARGPGAARGEVALDDDHVVYFEHDWPEDSQALAIATTWADDKGRVVAFDIRVNATVPWATDGHEERFDLQAAVTHEVGHVLGLEHSGVSEATMFAAHDRGEAWRQALHVDDEDGVRYLYGDGLAGPQREGLPWTCAHPPGAPSALWVALTPMVLWLRRAA